MLKNYFQDTIEGAFDASTGRYNSSQILQTLHDKKDIARAAIPSAKLSNLTRLLKRAETIGPQDLHSNALFKWGLEKGGIGIGVGALQLVSGREYIPTPLLLGGTLVASGLGAGQVMKRIINNKRLSHIATGALDATERSPKARITSKLLAGTLKGIQVYYTTPDGRKFPAEVTDKGYKIMGPEVTDPIEPNQSEAP